jgi:plastocyanin
MRLRNVWVCGVSLALAMSVVACGGGSKDEFADDAAAPGGAAAGGGGAKVDPATAGELTGSVVIDGTAPKNEPIRMAADPVCAKEAKGDQATESYIVGPDGKSLGNVLVYVKAGIDPKYSFDMPSEGAKIDQKECRYHPHVFAMRVGQPLEILNSDPTLHNIHAIPKVNSEFNNGQPIQGMKMNHTFTQKEVMVPFKCDVHGWMNAYVAVLDHPYYQVTAPDGKFDLKTLPPGKYTIEAWHEKLGATSQEVTIGDKESKEITFTFKAPAVATN